MSTLLMKLPFQKKSTPDVRRRVTPEARPSVYSYHARRSVEQGMTDRQLFRVPPTRKHASRAIHYSIRRIGAIAVLLAAAVSTVSILSVSSNANVQLVSASQGVFLHSVSTYQRATQKLLEGSLMNRTKATIDTGAIGTALMHTFPELAAVSIKLPLIGHRPIVYLTSTKSALLLTADHAGSYVVSDNGRVLGLVQGGTSLEIPNVAEQSNARLSVGQPALPSSTVSFIQAVVFQLKQKNIGISSFSLPASSSELDMYPGHAHYLVKFNLADGSTALQQIGTFLAVRHYLEGQGAVPAQYIDVRIDGRAYYK